MEGGELSHGHKVETYCKRIRQSLVATGLQIGERFLSLFQLQLAGFQVRLQLVDFRE